MSWIVASNIMNLIYETVIFNQYISKLITGKSLSEALFFASTNPQFDDILCIELQVQYVTILSSEHGENILCTEIVLNVKTNFCTQYVLPLFWAWNFLVLNFWFNEQSVIILWVSWCKNESFWQRFTFIILHWVFLFSLPN